MKIKGLNLIGFIGFIKKYFRKKILGLEVKYRHSEKYRPYIAKKIDKEGGEQHERISDFCCFHSQDQTGKDK